MFHSAVWMVLVLPTRLSQSAYFQSAIKIPQIGWLKETFLCSRWSYLTDYLQLIGKDSTRRCGIHLAVYSSNTRFLTSVQWTRALNFVWKLAGWTLWKLARDMCFHLAFLIDFTSPKNSPNHMTNFDIFMSMYWVWSLLIVWVVAIENTWGLTRIS